MRVLQVVTLTLDAGELILQGLDPGLQTLDLVSGIGFRLSEAFLLIPEVLALRLQASFQLGSLLAPLILILLDVGKLPLQSLIVVFQVGDLVLKRGL